MAYSRLTGAAGAPAAMAPSAAAAKPGELAPMIITAAPDGSLRSSSHWAKPSIWSASSP